MIQFGFEYMGLHRIEAEVMPENRASVQLLCKLDFQEEGVLHERSFWKGEYMLSNAIRTPLLLRHALCPRMCGK